MSVHMVDEGVCYEVWYTFELFMYKFVKEMLYLEGLSPQSSHSDHQHQERHRTGRGEEHEEPRSIDQP